VLPPPALDALAPERLAPVWREAVQRPPSPRHVVLLALAGADVVGFAALAPADDADLEPGAAAELLALAVEPAQRGAGHGSRLLQAVADLLAEARTPRAVAWVGEHEAALAAFLRGAGWGEDGAARTLDPVGDGSAPLHQRRWATRLADGP
jgi:GNAT superfamily N-acetyltransferase